jgi:RNA polymerase sigma-70 factor (ECF subfamily)
MTAIPKEPLMQFAKFDQSKSLVELASEGCAESFRQLVIEHQQLVRIYLARHIFCSSHLEDVAQEVFMVAYQQLKQFRNESKFSTWLLGIARNKALHFLRSQVNLRKKQKQLFEAEIANRKILRLENDDGEAEEQQSRLDALKSCLDQLPAQSKGLIERYYYDQQSSVSIAESTKQKSSSVRMKLLRIRKILFSCIRGKLGGLED